MSLISRTFLLVALTGGAHAGPPKAPPSEAPVAAPASASPAAVQDAVQAYKQALARYNAGDSAGYYDHFDEQLACFYGALNHPRTAVQQARKLQEGDALQVRVEAVGSAPHEVALVDRGAWRTSDRVGLHEKAVLMRLRDGRWRIGGEAPLGQAACLSSAFAAAAPAPQVADCRSKLPSCTEMCSNPTGSNGCESCRDGAWNEALACLDLETADLEAP